MQINVGALALLENDHGRENRESFGAKFLVFRRQNSYNVKKKKMFNENIV